MAAQFFVGTFTGRSSVGDKAVTGVGFTPKLLFILASDTASYNSVLEGMYCNVGWSTGDTSTTQWTMNVGCKWDGVAFFQAVTRRSRRTDELLSEITPDFGFLNQTATLKTFDSDGFTVTFTNAIAAREYLYLAIGGTGVSVKTGSGNWATSTGNQSFTGVGFQPTLLFLCAGGNYIGSESETDPGACFSYGWVDAEGRQGVSAWHEVHSGTSDNHRYQRTTKCVAVLDSTTGAVEAEAEFVSFDSDGFTINWTNAHSSAATLSYLAISGVFSHAGSLTQPSSTGTQEVDGLDVTADVVMFQSVGNTTSSSSDNHARYSLGFGTPAASVSTWVGDDDGTNFAGRRSVRRFSNTLCIQHAHPTGTAAGTVDAAAEITTAGDGAFELDWTTADATGREVLYLALGADASTPPDAGQGDDDSGLVPFDEDLQSPVSFFPTETWLQTFRHSSVPGMRYVALEFENLYAQLGGWLGVEHNNRGRHTILRSTSSYSATGFREYGRSVQLGDWIGINFDATRFTGADSMTWTVQDIDIDTDRYTLIGHTLIYGFRIVNTTVAGTPSDTLQIALPGGLVAERSMQGFVYAKDAGTVEIAVAQVAAGGSHVLISKTDFSNWTASTHDTDVYGQVICEVE